MRDTPEEIYDKQIEIFMEKPVKERFFLNLDLTEFIIEMTKKRIKAKNPDISVRNLKIAFFKEFYTEDFSENELNEIASHF